MIRRLISAFVSILLIFSFVSCKSNKQDENIVPETTQQTTIAQEATSQEATDEETEAEDKKEYINALGLYVGQIDGTSIEIIIDENHAAFRTEADMKPIIEALMPEDKVSITYYENEIGQNILTKIEKDKTLAKEYINIKGNYTGLIDNNSLEIIVEKHAEIEGSGGAMAFRIPNDMKPYFDSSSDQFKDFEKDNKVVFSFYENESKQLILSKLEKVE